MWNIFFNKKEKKMSTTTDSAAVKRLKNKVEKQATQISSLQGRVSELVDNLTLLSNDVKNFKAAVAGEMNQLFDKVD
jgi:predicted RNase H-like nuclease (RuvC/YqgF family)